MQRSSPETPTTSIYPQHTDVRVPAPQPSQSAPAQPARVPAPAPLTRAPDGSVARGSGQGDEYPAGAMVLRLPGLALARSRLRRALKQLRQMDQVSQQDAAVLFDNALADIHTAIDALA